MRLPLTIRVIFHSIRSFWAAAILGVTAWVGLADATPEERSALGARVGTERPVGLAQMRVARVMVHVAPERAARMLSDATNGEISPELAGMMLRHLASGAATAQAASGTQEPTQRDNRGQDGGAKFVQVD